MQLLTHSLMLVTFLATVSRENIEKHRLSPTFQACHQNHSSPTKFDNSKTRGAKCEISNTLVKSAVHLCLSIKMIKMVSVNFY